MRRGGEVRGPFPGPQVTRYILLGRINPTDEISFDRNDWRPVAEVDEVQPTGFENEESQVLALRRADERLADDRRANQTATENTEFLSRRKGVRRRDEPEHVVQHREVKTRFLKENRNTSGESVLHKALFAAVVLVLVVVAMFRYTPNKSAPEKSVLHCGDPAAAGVVWNNCHKEGVELNSADLHAAHINNADLTGAHMRGVKLGGSDLSYSNLSVAELSYSDLSQSLLVGAMLHSADLSYANLRGADLSYADLSGANLGAADLDSAKLDNAIWIDGSVCAVGSVGECRVR